MNYSGCACMWQHVIDYWWQVHGGFDVILGAIGRVPLVESLNLSSVGVKLTNNGFIDVDQWQQTSTEGVFAVGDVIENIQLTPVAIAAGRRLADRLFGGLSQVSISIGAFISHQ
jgi:glutathione reductase (NADPH)